MAEAAVANNAVQAEDSKRSPSSMYEICLSSFVRNLYQDTSQDHAWRVRELRLIRSLPRFVLVDTIHSMARDKEAHSIFCQQMNDVRLMGKLLRSTPVRQRLFKSLALVIEAGNKDDPCVHSMADSFVAFVEQHYAFVGRHLNQRGTTHGHTSNGVINGYVHNYKPGANLRRLPHQRRRQIGFSFFHDGDATQDDDELEEEVEGNRDYFFYGTVDALDSRGENGGFAKPKKRTTRLDLKISDQVWDNVFHDKTTVDKRNSGSQQLAAATTTGEEEKGDFQVLEKLMEANEIIYLIRQKNYMDTIDSGLLIGSFLAEAGWLEDAIIVYQETLYMIQCLDNRQMEHFVLTLDCLQRILNAQSRFCLFNEAHKTCLKINSLVELALSRDQLLPACLLARICKERSMMHFVRSEYDMSFNWAVLALQLLHKSTVSERVAIEVLLQAGKSCVVKRQYKRANLLITMAVNRTLALYGKNHQRYANALLDYGFYLLNVDLIVNSVSVYTEALEIKRAVFGDMNLNVGTANEDLAYALYVKEYSSGDFNKAREHIECAISTIHCLVPWNCLMLASAQRVKALILEEIALDQGFDQLLEQSEKLHESALRLALDAFGEINVQTAKHYGNLGRLYQSMSKFEEAEKMHKRAIKIKTDLLGAYDYEVGLSIGHLASLYNYQMQKHLEAEELYMKSIEISLRLFGESYSGLEYDYRGLCHIYELLHETDKYFAYTRILDSWRNKRNEKVEKMLIEEEEEEENDSASVEQVIAKFFEGEVVANGSGAMGVEGNPFS